MTDIALLGEALAAVDASGPGWLRLTTLAELDQLSPLLKEAEERGELTARSKAGREARALVERIQRRARLRALLGLDPAAPSCLRGSQEERVRLGDGRMAPVIDGFVFAFLADESAPAADSDALCTCAGDVLDELSDEEVDELRGLSPSRLQQELRRRSKHLHRRRAPSKRRSWGPKPAAVTAAERAAKREAAADADAPEEPVAAVVAPAAAPPQPVSPARSGFDTPTGDRRGKFTLDEERERRRQRAMRLSRRPPEWRYFDKDYVF